MSKIAISGASTGTATFTLESPATSTNRTLTLPDETGTILTNATTAGFPAGSVLQVVSFADVSAAVNTTSTSFVTTSLTASITPSSASNKILIIFSACIDDNGSGGNPVLSIYRGDSDIAPAGSIQGGFVYIDEVLDGRLLMNQSSLFLDSPATTSSTAYTMRIKSKNGGQVSYRSDLTAGVITLMEIAA